MKILTIGCGMMGSAIAFDLAQSSGVSEILLADIDELRAADIAQTLSSKSHSKIIRSARLDVNYYDDVVEAMTGVDAAIGAVSYTQNYLLTRAAIEARTHFFDLGGNNDVVNRQLALDQQAKAANVLIVPNCGLAPGLANVLAASGANRFEKVIEIHLRVGGLPQQPRPPLNYQLVFAPEGLINEYVEPAEVIRDGKLTQVESMTDIEEISFPPRFSALEAFNTSGGLSRLGRMFDGKVQQMDYKTIRYKGHCEKFRTLIEVGFASNEPIIVGDTIRTAREIFGDLLRKKLNSNGPDVVLLRVTMSGIIGGSSKTLAYEMIDYYDDANMMTAMMRTTAFPTSIIAQLVASNTITARGVLPPEQCVPAGPLVEELKKRNIIITETLS